MAERKPCKGLNSKCFLITYLVIVGFLLVLWMNRLPMLQEESRDIPDVLSPYIESPARPITDMSLMTLNQFSITEDWFKDKWTFVYFSHDQCLPDCEPAMQVLKGLKSAFANNDVQFLVVGFNIDHESVEQVSHYYVDNGMPVTVASSQSHQDIEQLAREFIALYLVTDYADDTYLVEQEHNVFLVDPKGRVYATFTPPFTHKDIPELFLKLRHFYAKSERLD
jgi:cytochrome oxidase Cu insertion factor (SCO1/SenC/PrrC family)